MRSVGGKIFELVLKNNVFSHVVLKSGIAGRVVNCNAICISFMYLNAIHVRVMEGAGNLL